MAQNIKIPKKAPLPTSEVAIKLFMEFMSQPVEKLGGLRPSDLFSFSQDIDRTWFIGSVAWMPLVKGKPWNSKSDIDIVFAVPGTAVAFGEHVRRVIANKTGEDILIEENRFKGPKLCRKKGKGFLDAWDIPDGQTIHEHIMTFPRDHERCAIMAGAAPGEVNALTRIVRIPRRHRVPVKRKAKVPTYYFHDGS